MLESRIVKDGVVIHRSKNSRGIRDYARRVPVFKCEIDRVAKRDGYTVKFTFVDGATEESTWGSDESAHDWCLARRAWGKPIRYHTERVRGVAYKTTLFWYTEDSPLVKLYQDKGKV